MKPPRPQSKTTSTKLIDWFNDDHIDELKWCYKKITSLRLPTKTTLRPKWEYVIIALLLGLLLGGHSAPPRIIRSQFIGPTQGLDPKSIKPLSLLKNVSYSPQNELQPVYLNKVRPYGTYDGSQYTPGQCTYGVASRLPIPSDWGNANNWAYAASLAGYTVSNVPKAGSVAQTTGDSFYGHVAVVEVVNPDGSFLIWEMNYSGPFSQDERVVTTAEFPNFIYIP